MLAPCVVMAALGIGEASAQAQCASDQYTYTFTNYCPYPIWIGESGAAANNQSYPPQGGNWALAAQCTSNAACSSGTCDTNAGQCICTTSSDCSGGATCQANGKCTTTSTFCMPQVWTSGTFWPRTNCSVVDTMHLDCATGQCTASGDTHGLLDCGFGTTSPTNPVTQFEVTSATGTPNNANYDVSLVAGANVEMKVTPTGGSYPLGGVPAGQNDVACYVAGCSSDLDVTCPTNLQVKSGATVIGCLDTCTQCQRTAPTGSTPNAIIYAALKCDQPIAQDASGKAPGPTTNCSGAAGAGPSYQDMYCVQNFSEATRATGPIKNAQASSNQGTPTATSQNDCFPGTTYIVPNYPTGYQPPAGAGVCLYASAPQTNISPNFNNYGWADFASQATLNCQDLMDGTACGGYLTGQTDMLPGGGTQKATYAQALGYTCRTVTYLDNLTQNKTAHLCLPPTISGLGTCTYDSQGLNPLYTGVGGVFNASWLQAGVQAGGGSVPYYETFKNACNSAYAWQYDDASSGFACYATVPSGGGATFSGFSVTFCGSQAPPSGQSSANTVYKPLQPCRIMDTRSATLASGVKGPLTGNALYSIPGFLAPGSDWSQYGATTNPSNCGLTNPPGGSIHALALVITILNPNYDAYLGVSDINDLTTTLSTVALNYTQGQGLSTMYLVPQASSNSIYFAMPPQLTADLLFDVVGYSVVPDATALQCTTQSSGASTIAASGGTGTAASPACSLGYTLTSGSCDSDSQSVALSSDKASGQAWLCAATNSGASAAHLTATANCCRLPGK
ncbi:MAG: thaumatin family protein [Casimicrobiaceae bacterium]